MDYSKRIVQLFGERCTKESRHHDRDSEPEWCDRCFAYAQQDEIERLREALKDIDSQMRQADRYFLKESTLTALQQKETE